MYIFSRRINNIIIVLLLVQWYDYNILCFILYFIFYYIIIFFILYFIFYILMALRLEDGRFQDLTLSVCTLFDQELHYEWSVFTQVYEWVLVTYLWVQSGNRVVSHPWGRGNTNTFSFMPQRLRLKLWLCGSRWFGQGNIVPTFLFICCCCCCCCCCCFWQTHINFCLHLLLCFQFTISYLCL